MDSESPLPAKRLRTTLNGNLQLTECVREFKLPRQFPSMVTKASSDAISDKSKIRPSFNASPVTCFGRTPMQTKAAATSQEIPATSVIRKIKLKGKDGRDLGEVNVQDLPPNIQGKTITLAKNGIIKSPEINSPTEKSKGIPVGMLTPVNILKNEKLYTSNLSSVSCDNKDQREVIDSGKDSKKTMIIEQKQMSAVMDQQGRPQVLVFQSGKNWHMVKIATTGPVSAPQNGKNMVLSKLPMVKNGSKVTVMQTKEENQSNGKQIIQNGCEKLMGASKTSGTNNSSMVVKRWPLRTSKDSNAERHESRSPVLVENKDSKPKIEISRVFGSSVGKTNTHSQFEAQTGIPQKLTSKSVLSAGHSPRKSAPLKQDVMVVLPSDIPESLGSDSEFAVSSVEINRCGLSTETKPSNCAAAKSGKTIKSDDSPASRDFVPAKKAAKKSAEKNDAISSRLNILTKALSTVEDKELRARALKALADCGIGMERLVPICPEADRRPVKDSNTQTDVFGVIEPEHFIHVTPENPALERIRPIERKAPQKIGHIVGNPHPQELSLNNLDVIDWVSPAECNELASMVNGYLEGNDEVTEVRKIFTKRAPPRLVTQLEEDFMSYNKYDENGLLNIHRAVMNDDLPVVTRLLKVLKALEEGPDLTTEDGKYTSLELAIRYEVSPSIVKLLLDAGAEPTSSETSHDSALIIASKKSLPILKDLIPYVRSHKSLDNYDSSGFAAVHYCAQNNNKFGVIELARASADLNLRDCRSGRTPLFHAIENEHIELAQLLLDKGAQPNIASYSGHTVFALVEEGKHYSLAESLNRAGK